MAEPGPMTKKVMRLGRFQTEALLGQGGVTETYRGRVAGGKPGADERRFVITVLRGLEGRPDPQQAVRFIEAARQLAGLDQSGFVRVTEIGEGPGPIYAVHEFKAGVDLTQLRGQAAAGVFMDPRLVGLLARKIAERLSVLHGRSQAPRAHGGLNSGNVLVAPDGEVLLLDCGLAEVVRPRGDAFVSRWFFAAPEQISGAAPGPASDLYSIGALIYFLYSGMPPFVASSVDALIAKIAAGPPSLPNMPHWLSAVMARLLSSEASLRPKSAVDVARQISAAMMAAEAGGMPTRTAVVADVAGPLAVTPPTTIPDGGRSVLPSAPYLPATPAAAPSADEASAPADADEAVTPFSLDEAITEDERPHAAARAAGSGGVPVVPFSLEPAPSGDDDDPNDRGASDISADDPDVGVVYDDDDDEQEQVEVGADGKVKRRRRRRLRIPVWYRSPLARKMSRMALVPLVGLLMFAALAGVFFYREWAATRAESERKNQQLLAEAAQRAVQLRPPAPAESTPLPPGQLEVKTTPSGATVWLDGVQKQRTPTTLITKPGSHHLVVTLTGYRMFRDVLDTSKGLLWEREMFVAPRLDSGRVPLSVGCVTEGRYPIFVDGKDSGELCPASDLKVEPGRHSIGLFVIPQNRIWTFDREVQLNRPHRVQFNY
jgi:serine/threonine protein kinase